MRHWLIGKDSRKKLKAVRRALALGLPVAGLLATAGCERAKNLFAVPEAVAVSEKDISRIQGQIRSRPEDQPDRPKGKSDFCDQNKFESPIK